MKVLQPPEVEEKKREEDAKKVQRAVKLHELVREEETALNQAREEHRKNIEQLAVNFLAFSKEIDERKVLLGREVEILEARKQKTLEAIDPSLKEAREKAKEIMASEEKLGVKIRKFQKEQESLDERATKILDKEKELSRWEREIMAEQRATAVIKEKTTRAALKLDRDKRFFDIWKEKLIDNMQESDSAFNKTTAEIESQRKLNEKQRVENEKELIRIRDRQQTLKDAFDELKQKQNG